ncbi:MAG TPA: hypothetical protein PLS74_02200 [Bacteroidales bacterium]|nr:hypothetical protein [Bacteroidales bacterium]HOM39569.1 hypothetical protein [Bacteroidales bacterium]
MTGRLLLMSFFTLAFLLAGCNSSTRKNTQFLFPDEDSIPLSQAEQLSDEAIDDITRNISSPVEIANILQRMNVPFSNSYLASSIDASRITTSFDRALKLGILGADLGYLNMYEKTGSSIDILSSIKKLADGINVGQFFDFETLKRLSLNRSNLDSLLFLSLESYNQIDRFLREKGRSQLSALMVTGVWIEGQYLATQVLKQYPDTLLRSRVGEQKVILNDIIMLLAPYCNVSKEYTDLCRDMQELKEKYRNVKVTFTVGEPQMVEKDGALVVVQTDQSNVEMTDEQLEAIINTTEKIRNRLISNE